MLTSNFIQIDQELGIKAIQTRRYPMIPEDRRRCDPMGLKFFSSCFFVNHCAHTKFHRNWSRIRHKSHINTKIPEESRRSRPIGLKFFSSCFFVKHYAHTKFQRNWSRIRHSSHTKLRKFTKLAEV